jgi:hypothetical protein
MNWNPFKRIADLERRVNEMHHEMLVAFADYAMRINMLERTKAKEAAAGFVNPAPKHNLLTAEEAQRIADKRVRANAAARKHYAKRKAKEVQP